MMSRQDKLPLVWLIISAGIISVHSTFEYVICRAMFRNVLQPGTDSLLLFDAGVGQVSFDYGYRVFGTES